MAGKPTPEEIEAARALVAQADEEEQQAARAAALASVQPLADLGFGTDNPIEATVSEIIQSLRNLVPSATSDLALLNLYSATANCLTTLNDRVRTIISQNQG